MQKRVGRKIPRVKARRGEPFGSAEEQTRLPSARRPWPAAGPAGSGVWLPPSRGGPGRARLHFPAGRAPCRGGSSGAARSDGFVCDGSPGALGPAGEGGSGHPHRPTDAAGGRGQGEAGGRRGREEGRRALARRAGARAGAGGARGGEPVPPAALGSGVRTRLCARAGGAGGRAAGIRAPGVSVLEAVGVERACVPEAGGSELEAVPNAADTQAGPWARGRRSPVPSLGGVMLSAAVTPASLSPQ